MKEKKHIDELFKTHLKNFEAQPQPEVWDAIEQRIKKEKGDRRILPFWWRYAGVAAALLLVFTLGNVMYNKYKNSTPETIVNTETKDDLINTKDKKENTNNEVIVDNNKEEHLQKEDQNPLNNFINKKNVSTSIVSSKTEIKNQFHKQKNSNYVANTSEVVTSKNTSKPETLASTEHKNSKTKNTTEKDVSKEKIQQNISNKNLKEAVAEQQNKPKDSTLTIEDAIAQNELKTDSISVLENGKKWEVYASVSPVYYNTLGQGSHIDAQFNNNSKSGDINMSYGVNVGYAVSRKLAIRSGIRSTTLSYNTNDVVVLEGVNSPNSRVFNVANLKSKTNAPALVSASRIVSNNSALDLSNVNAVLNQEIKYIEVPLELEYKLLEKRFGINIITGVSTFILDENTVHLDYNNTTTEIGEANNINNVSFSGNIGIGLDYKLSKNLELNVEPTFKYQLNAFENTSGNFNPYVLGLNTGVSFKF